MAAKLVKCGRVVTYLPSIRTAVIRCRAFSSASDSIDLHIHEVVDDTKRVQTVWPDHLLGPLGPQDKRFPMPGSVGPCVNGRRLQQELDAKPQKFPEFDLDSVLPPLTTQRHIDIAEQFLISIDEIDFDFVDKAPSSPMPADEMEYRAHNCPMLLRKEFKELFPNRNIMEGDLTVITISLKTKNDMKSWTSDVEREREQLLDTFVNSTVEICDAFEKDGFWADFIDPSSGKPFKGPHTNFTLFETDERYRTLGFEILDLGCCKVISHPLWGTHSYIGSLFTTAPLDHPLVANLKLPQ